MVGNETYGYKAVEDLHSDPTYSGGHFYPPGDNAWDLGSVDLSWRNLYVDTIVYVASTVLTGDITMADTKGILTGLVDDDYFYIGAVDNDTNTITELLRFVGAAAPYTLASQPITVADDVLFRLGTTFDQVFLNRSTTLAADAELTGVIVGTSTHKALAANSLIISNITTDGDFLLALSDGGSSKQMIYGDGSDWTLHLGSPETPSYVGGGIGGVFIGNKLEVRHDAYFRGPTWFKSTIDMADDTQIRTGTDDGDNFTIRADKTGVGVAEVARAQGAADPYFSMGGSQEFKFYNSGVATFGAFTLGGTLSGGNNDLGTQASPVGLIIAKNNAGIEFLDSGGIPRKSILLDGTNKFRIRNIAGGSIELYTDSASGAGNPVTRLTMTGNVALSAVTWASIAAYTIGCASFGVLGVAAQAQQAHIVDADGQLADITTKFNTLLADLEGYGFLAAS